MKTPVFCALIGAIVLMAACSGSSSTPMSPSSTPATSAAASSSTSGADDAALQVGVSGLIRDLDAANRSFTLLLTASTTTMTRGDSRLVRANDSTQLTVKGSPARFAALADGMTISVRGTDQGRYILAQSIVAR